MPALLRPEDEASWLDVASTKAHEALSQLAPYPSEWLAAYPTSRQVNVPTYEDPCCLTRSKEAHP